MRPTRLFITLLILLAALLAACSGPAAAPATSTPAQPQAPNTGEAETVVATGFDRIQTSPHREDCSTDFGDEKIRSLIEFQPPDRRHILDTEDPNDAEAYLIGDVYYWFDTESQQWNKTQMNNSGQEAADPARTNFETAGEEAIDSKLVKVYQFVQTMEQYGVQITQQMKVWIGAEDGLIYQTESQGDVLGVNDKGEAFKRPAKASCTFVYDPAIEVKIPIE
jgi:hypothetical protein